MANELCPCSNLEWLPEHLTLEHHPDCDTQKRLGPSPMTEALAEYLAMRKIIESHNIGSRTTTRVQIDSYGKAQIKRTFLQYYLDPNEPEKVTNETEIRYEITMQ